MNDSGRIIAVDIHGHIVSTDMHLAEKKASAVRILHAARADSARQFFDADSVFRSPDFVEAHLVRGIHNRSTLAYLLLPTARPVVSSNQFCTS
ncbi:hypothetical protein ACQUJT_20145 [Ralstonia pseudosolanacearum]